MAAIGNIVLVHFHNLFGPGWSQVDQVEHPAIVTGTYADPNVIDATVFIRNQGPTQKAKIANESVATAPASGYGSWLSWRVPPA